jgi:hypothetical protein
MVTRLNRVLKGRHGLSQHHLSSTHKYTPNIRHMDLDTSLLPKDVTTILDYQKKITETLNIIYHSRKDCIVILKLYYISSKQTQGN